MTNPYVPLLIMSAAALVLAFGGLGASAILGPTKKSTTKADNYECGIQPTSAHLTEGRFPVRYYLVAMTFIIFDIEVVFMYVGRQLQPAGPVRTGRHDELPGHPLRPLRLRMATRRPGLLRYK